MKYKVGDEVMGVKAYDGNAGMIGNTGKIVEIRDGLIYDIIWDKKMGRGHDSSGRCKVGHGWNVNSNQEDCLNCLKSAKITNWKKRFTE